MSTHNIYFHGEIRKILYLISRPMNELQLFIIFTLSTLSARPEPILNTDQMLLSDYTGCKSLILISVSGVDSFRGVCLCVCVCVWGGGGGGGGGCGSTEAPLTQNFIFKRNCG